MQRIKLNKSEIKTSPRKQLEETDDIEEYVLTGANIDE